MSDYDLDFYSWTQRQGALLRRLAAGERVNDADLDWPNIAFDEDARSAAVTLARTASSGR